MCTALKSIAKYFLFVTNLIICLLSIVVFSLSIWILVDSPSFLTVLGFAGESIPVYTTGAILLLVASILGFIISCFGCCGAIKENKCMLATYSVAILFLLALIITGVVLAFTTDLQALKKPLMETLVAYNPESKNEYDKALVQAWDDFQRDVKCCGVDARTDWSKYNPYYGGTPPVSNKKTKSSTKKAAEPAAAASSGLEKVPKSCCDPGKNQALCTVKPTSSNGIYIDGCFTKVTNTIANHAGVIGGVSLAVLIIMALNFCISCYMCTCGRADTPNRSMYGKTATKDF